MLQSNPPVASVCGLFVCRGRVAELKEGEENMLFDIISFIINELTKKISLI